MLEITDLDLKYGQSQILHGISLTAPLGAVTTIMGTNGVGKTSLLKAIAGRYPPSRGQVSVDGRPLPGLTAVKAAHSGIAYVPQGREVFPMLTVLENLQTGFACLPKSDHAIPSDIYDLFPVLNDMLHRRGGDLSGGQQQQLSIARALIMRPKVLLLDEPTEGIQPNIIQQIGEAIKTLRARSTLAIVLVEQNVDFAYGTSDHFVMMKRGAIVNRLDKATCKTEDLIAGLAL